MTHLLVFMQLLDGDDSTDFTCSVLELVDAAVDPSLLQPIKETILMVDGVKVQLLPGIQFLYMSQFCIF